MRLQQLEAMVMAAVDRVRSGMPAEDDRFEFKREWPRADKARQLAGAANRLHGEGLVYVIGIDEKTGVVHQTENVDPAKWWTQVSAQFDQVAPNLARHATVYLSESESVVALLFETDRAPYVVKTTGTSEREVPIREGTRTRSARRDELLRLLMPTVATPPAVLMRAQVSATLYEAREPDSAGSGGRDAHCYLYGDIAVFLESIGAPCFLPAHLSTAELLAGTQSFEVKPWSWSRKSDTPEPTMGVSIRSDGIIATGPGTFTFGFYNARFPTSMAAHLEDAEILTLLARFPVAGGVQPVRIDANLRRHAGLSTIAIPGQTHLGTWGFEVGAAGGGALDLI